MVRRSTEVVPSIPKPLVPIEDDEALKTIARILTAVEEAEPKGSRGRSSSTFRASCMSGRRLRRYV
jgi:hypothetical protein